MNYVEIFEKSILQVEKLVEKSRKTGRKVIEKLVSKPYNEFDKFFGSFLLCYFEKWKPWLWFCKKVDYHIQKTFVVPNGRTIHQLQKQIEADQLQITEFQRLIESLSVKRRTKNEQQNESNWRTGKHHIRSST